MKKRLCRFASIILTVLILQYAADAEAARFVHGSADTPRGRTLVFSIFASDPNYSWNMARDSDQKRMENIRAYLNVMEAYVERVAREYGADCDLETDFIQEPELRYYAYFDTDMEGSEGQDEAVWGYIDAQISVNDMMQTMNADHCVFFVLMNTDDSTEAITCTRNWYADMPYPYELVYLYYIDSGVVNCPAVYAHELFHAFGAPDYYMPDAEYGMDDSFVEYIAQNEPHDIMFNCSDPETGEYLYDRIENPTGALTAYYIGLTDECPMQEKLGLEKSQHTP